MFYLKTCTKQNVQYTYVVSILLQEINIKFSVIIQSSMARPQALHSSQSKHSQLSHLLKTAIWTGAGRKTNLFWIIPTLRGTWFPLVRWITWLRRTPLFSAFCQQIAVTENVWVRSYRPEERSTGKAAWWPQLMDLHLSSVSAWPCTRGT